MARVTKIVLVIVVVIAGIFAARFLGNKISAAQSVCAVQQVAVVSDQPVTPQVPSENVDLVREPRENDAPKPVVTESEYAFLKTEMAKAIFRDRDIQVDDILFTDSRITIIFQNPDRPDLESVTISSLYMMTLSAAVVTQTTLRNTIDRVVLISKFRNGEALQISGTVTDLMAIAESRIQKEEILDYISIEQYRGE